MQKIGLYIISFIEGLVLMAFQLIISRILASNFGATLNVWAVILSATLLGLGLGYLIGGKLANSHKSNLKVLKIYLGILFVLLIFLVSIGNFLSGFTLEMPGVSGLIVFSIVGIVPFSFLLGLVTPLIISQLNKVSVSTNGSIAGKLYANSTIGGIFGTFLFGLVLIPQNGLFFSSIILAILSGLSWAILWVLKD